MIIVLGASGFIGTYLVDELLEQGYEVTATGRNEASREFFNSKGVKFVNVDIRNKEDFEKLPKENVEAVILLAGLLPANVKDDNAYEYIDINITGTIHALEFCRQNGIKKLIATTSYSDVQNAWQAERPLKETEPRDIKFTGDHAKYVISKNAATDFIEHYSQEYGMKGIVFKLPPVYGVGPHAEIYANGKYYKTGIQTFIEKAQNSEPIEIWGDGQLTRDIVYVKDVVDAFILSIRSDKAQGVYNMTSGVPLTLEDQVKTVIDIFSPEDKKSEIIYRPEKKTNTSSFIFDISKAREDFGYNPKFLSYREMMLDYKKEMESGRFDFLVNSRKKDKE